jgi:hypothetical protein
MILPYSAFPNKQIMRVKLISRSKHFSEALIFLENFEKTKGDGAMAILFHSHCDVITGGTTWPLTTRRLLA